MLTCRLAPYRHSIRITPELGDVTLNPLQSELLVNWRMDAISERNRVTVSGDVRKPAFKAPSFFMSSPGR